MLLLEGSVISAPKFIDEMGTLAILKSSAGLLRVSFKQLVFVAAFLFCSYFLTLNNFLLLLCFGFIFGSVIGIPFFFFLPHAICRCKLDA